MKKVLAIILILAISLMVIPGCSNSVIETTKEQNETSLQTDETKENTMKVDLDVTNFSTTILYALLQNMVTVPDDYIGKVVKISGNMSSWKDDRENDVYCLTIWDETLCCSAEIRIKFDMTKIEKESIPNPGEDYTVIGIFDSEYDNGVFYSYLGNCILVEN